MELVVIMQQGVADLVEEYVDEVEVAEDVAGIEEWIEELGVDNCGFGEDADGSQRERKMGHKRHDSAVGLEYEFGQEPDVDLSRQKEKIKK